MRDLAVKTQRFLLTVEMTYEVPVSSMGNTAAGGVLGSK